MVYFAWKFIPICHEKNVKAPRYEKGYINMTDFWIIVENVHYLILNIESLRYTYMYVSFTYCERLEIRANNFNSYT